MNIETIKELCPYTYKRTHRHSAFDYKQIDFIDALSPLTYLGELIQTYRKGLPEKVEGVSVGNEDFSLHENTAFTNIGTRNFIEHVIGNHDYSDAGSLWVLRNDFDKEDNNYYYLLYLRLSVVDFVIITDLFDKCTIHSTFDIVKGYNEYPKEPPRWFETIAEAISGLYYLPNNLWSSTENTEEESMNDEQDNTQTSDEELKAGYPLTPKEVEQVFAWCESNPKMTEIVKRYKGKNDGLLKCYWYDLVNFLTEYYPKYSTDCIKDREINKLIQDVWFVHNRFKELEHVVDIINIYRHYISMAAVLGVNIDDFKHYIHDNDDRIEGISIMGSQAGYLNEALRKVEDMQEELHHQNKSIRYHISNIMLIVSNDD